MGTFNATFNEDNQLNAEFGSIQRVSTSNYEDLYNLPYINDRKVIGSKTAADYNLQDKMDTLSVQDIEKILYLG